MRCPFGTRVFATSRAGSDGACRKHNKKEIDPSMMRRREEAEENDDDMVCLNESFFVNRDYELTTFTFGRHSFDLYCLRSASTDYDLTGQLVWPGALLLNDYLSKNSKILEGQSVIELGSGVGITGILCSRFCYKIVLTDYNEEVLEVMRKNIEHHSISKGQSSASLTMQKLEWGNNDHIRELLQKNLGGFDLVLGADICFQQSSIPLLFNTVKMLLGASGAGCKFILAYVSRAKIMDVMVMNEAIQQGMKISEVQGTKSNIANLEGVIFEITLS